MQTSNPKRSWDLPNRLEALAAVSKEVFTWLADLPLSARAKYSTGLAVEEMVTNMIQYGFDDNREHIIHIDITYTNDHMILVFEDDGHEFDPTLHPAPDIERIVESRRAGGLGIALVRRMCAKMEYERIGNRNRLTLLIRRLEPDDTQLLPRVF